MLRCCSQTFTLVNSWTKFCCFHIVSKTTTNPYTSWKYPHACYRTAKVISIDSRRSGPRLFKNQDFVFVFLNVADRNDWFGIKNKPTPSFRNSEVNFFTCACIVRIKHSFVVTPLTHNLCIINMFKSGHQMFHTNRQILLSNIYSQAQASINVQYPWPYLICKCVQE